MATINLENIKKIYPNGYEAVHDISLSIAEGEFMVLVGPSGCGKTTLLRMVAGLEDISHGSLKIGEKVVNEVSPKDRDIAMVFQNYALYPHMTVAENIGFALKLKKLPKEEIGNKVRAAAELLGLTEWLDRKPRELSGGQRQRVAMGRAIVREPSVFLMDEPLSNLDAKLRVKMRSEVLKIQRQLGVATMYVTHDQTEAMTMGDRVAVLNSGNLLQCDTPQNLYDYPIDQFVASFIGSPAINLYQAELTQGAKGLILAGELIDLPDSVLVSHPILESYASKQITVGIRPEDLSLADELETNAVGAVVEIVEALGSELIVHFTIKANSITVEGAIEEAETIMESKGAGVARIEPRAIVKAGDNVRLKPNSTAFHFFDSVTGIAIY
ncbi:sn-glycerol-3-phosphate ABC transporter ATP-binding protein UgpC [Acidithrix sp. C25]|uniref:ABC transporter ATP-binding protein n=1 Tax=Acidithrix sp. C25 TaxID=1671482 RepID=UPI00191BBDB4|nr:sn-glycerol-3-phosphate ABC transporter ATP-binding protein UgpC [Acidithrix sp. C25]